MTVRGQVIHARFGDVDEPKYFVVVSSNTRNRKLPTVLGVRVTTTRRAPMETIIELPAGEPVHGRVLCDAITEIWDDEVIGTRGAMSPRTMQQINTGLRAALALD